ncbi:MAG: flagellar basal body P-ring formation protein FlgA [Firmicutes bacterium]|nr:flagellar basal body P-ring formation protein FlgA [Bacillota bacterium]
MELQRFSALVLTFFVCVFVFSPLVKAEIENQELVVIDLKEQAEVWGRDIFLDEIGEISGPLELAARVGKVRVGTAPLVGNSRRLTPGHVEVRLRQAGIDLDRLELRGAGRTEVTGLGAKGDSEEAGREPNLSAGTVVVAARDLSRGEVLEDSDLLLEERELRGANYGDFTLEDFVGLRTTRRLKAGSILTAQSAEAVPVVERGAQIRITAVIGTIYITAPGVARGTGQRGDLIPVENSVSRQIIYGRIVDQDTVQVVVGGV